MTQVSPPAVSAPDRAAGGGSALPALLLALAGGMVGLVAVVAAALRGAPLLGPLLVAGLLAIPFLLLRPVLCLALLTVVEFANLSDVAAAHGVPGVYIAVLLLAGSAAALAVRRGELRPAWSPVLLAGFLFLVARALAAVFGIDPAASQAVVTETAKSLVWLGLLVCLLLARGPAPRAAARAMVITLAVLSALVVVQQFLLHNSTHLGGLANVPLPEDIGAATPRHAGPQADVNFWGRVLVMGLPFALSLAREAAGLSRLAWIGSALLIGADIVLTGSRGALIAAGVAVLVWALLTGGAVRRALLFAPFVLPLLLLLPGVGSRLATLLSLGARSGIGLPEPSLQGRVAATKVALQTIIDHPALGVGPGNFIAAEPGYLHRLGLQKIPLLAPHNSYLEAAAEGGLLGLTAWLVLLGSALVVALHARLVLRSAAVSASSAHVLRNEPVSLANAVVAALTAWAVASVFLHLATFRSFLLVAAMAAALDVRVRRLLGPTWVPTPRPVAARAARSRRVRRAAATAAVLMVGLSPALALVSWATPETWTARAGMRLVVKPTPSRDTGSYDLEALTRTGVVHTFTVLAGDPRFLAEGSRRLPDGAHANGSLAVDVSNTPPSALIELTVTAPNAATATAAATATRDAAAGYINGLSPLYGVEPLTEPAAARKAAPLVDARLALLPLAAALPLAGWYVILRRRAAVEADRQV